MSSHREAPEISKDPVADNTDVYAFRSPDRPDTSPSSPTSSRCRSPTAARTSTSSLMTSSTPSTSQHPGPGADVIYRFQFNTKIRNPKTFLYNTGPITNIRDTTWNRPQYYTVSRDTPNSPTRVLASRTDLSRRTTSVRGAPRTTRGWPARPCTRWARGRSSPASAPRASTSTWAASSTWGRSGRSRRRTSSRRPTRWGSTATKTFNVHTIAIQVPIGDLTRHRNKPDRPDGERRRHRGVGELHRRKSPIFDSDTGKSVGHGPWQQVSRLGNPLFNEVIVPMAEKDEWNVRAPRTDSKYAKYVNRPSSPSCCRCSTRACSPSSRRTPSPART